MHTPNPQLRAGERGEKGEWEPAIVERVGGWEDRKEGEQRKRGHTEGGRIRVGVVKKKKSKREVVG